MTWRSSSIARRTRTHGDFATNVALQLAKRVGRKPREAAEAIVAAHAEQRRGRRSADIAGSRLHQLHALAGDAFRGGAASLDEGAAFGRGDAAPSGAFMVEFVSANPTGPLHVGHGRQAALGDAISALLEWQGWRVTREFYYNDAGNQIANLALSVQARIRQARGECGRDAQGRLSRRLHPRDRARIRGRAFRRRRGRRPGADPQVRRRLPAQRAGHRPAAPSA